MTASILSPILERIRASKGKARVKRTLYPGRAKYLKRRQYQQEDIEWLKETKRGILAWAPGLGKTLGATEAAVLPAVVSCPLNLVRQWEDHLTTQYPQDRVVVCTAGDFIKRSKALEQPFDWMIVGHDMWRLFSMPECETLIVDEIHHFRNREAERSKNLFVHSQLTPRVYGLTATPVYKDVGDLWHQLHILDPKKWGAYHAFINNWAVVDSGSWGSRVVRSKNDRALKEAIAPYVKERTYREVGMFLPDRIDKHVLLEMEPSYKKDVYDRLRDHYRLELDGELKRFENAGAVLHMLRKITVTDEKIQAVKDIIADIPENKPVIVFVWYKDTADQVAEALDGIVIDGDMPPDKRRDYARSGGPHGKQVRVATMASLSEGVDLSKARTVIFVEQDYVPGKNYQAMTRVQRARAEELSSDPESQEPVIAYWLRYKNTVDEIVHQTARSRTTGNALSVLKEALGID